jgi:hypothetical protein
VSRDCSITLTWADGDYIFRLKLGQLRELQEKCDAGPAEIYRRCVTHTWRIDDIRETIRLGLIGGGTTPEAALKLVKTYVDDRPLMESVLPAQSIIGAVLSGVPDEEPGKAEAAEASGPEPASSQEGSCLSPPFTELEPL